MTTTLPVPVAFALPDGWEPGDPDAVGAPGAAFIARHPEPDDGYFATIAVDGAPLELTLVDVADRSVRDLGAGGSAALRERAEAGSAEVPGLTQTVVLVADVGGARRDLVQDQAYVLFPAAAGGRVWVRAVLTATAGQHGERVGDFRRFVASLEHDRSR